MITRCALLHGVAGATGLLGWRPGPGHVIQLEAGDPITILAGVHVGCYELFGTERVRTIRDLKGKTVAVTELGTNWRFLNELKKELKG